jgi:hypothetical protein
MNISSIISEYKRLETSLADEVMGKQDEQIILELDHRMRESWDQLVQARPTNKQDALAQITFFLDIAEKIDPSSPALAAARQILSERLTPNPTLMSFSVER